MKKINSIIRTFSIAMLLVMSIASKAQTQTVVRSMHAENKVAILPMTYIGDGNEVRMDAMRYRLQSIAYQYLKSDALELKFQDPSVTNALLLKNGVDESNFRQFTPRELAEILHVEYVITGTVTQESNGITSMHVSRREDHHHRRGGNHREIFGSTRTKEQMNTHIEVNVYNDKGENIYGKSRRSILSDVDAYKPGIQYLLKRSPLYKR